jgi:hypothetical protein
MVFASEPPWGLRLGAALAAVATSPGYLMTTAAEEERQLFASSDSFTASPVSAQARTR